MKVFCVVLIDPRGNINPDFEETIQRQLRYSRELEKSYKNSKYLILTTTPRISFPGFPSANFIAFGAPKRMSLKFAIKSAMYLKKLEFEKIVLTCADPWESFISVLLIEFLCGRKYDIQVQLHADITDKKWIQFTKINRIRYHLAIKLLPFASQIRVMSENQRIDLKRIIPKVTDRIVVSPVPLNTVTQIGEGTKSVANAPRIGFVGRLEEDRGLERFCEIVRTLNEHRQDFKLVISGQGNRQVTFLEQLSSIVGRTRLSFNGFLSGLDLSRNYSQLDLLLSTAPSESYGRAMRESIIAGVPVVAVDSSASREIQELVGSSAIQILDENTSEADIVTILEDGLASKNLTVAAEKLKAINDVTVKKIVGDWVRLID